MLKRFVVIDHQRARGHFVWRAGGAAAHFARSGARVTVAYLSYGERGESAQLWRQGKSLEEIKSIRHAEAEQASNVAPGVNVGGNLIGVPQVAPLRTAPDRDELVPSRSPSRHHTGLGEQARGHARDGRAGTPVAVLHRRRRTPRRLGAAQFEGDNLMIHAAVEVIELGDVLMVTTTSASTDGMFGELLATSLRVRGCTGLSIDAGDRDVADCAPWRCRCRVALCMRKGQ